MSSPRFRFRLIVAAAAVVLSLRAMGGCGAATDAGRADAGPDAEAAPPKRDAGEDEPFVPTQGTLDGWEAWPDYDPACKFYTPASPSSVPPLVWEPCAPATPHSGAGCRQLRLDWEEPTALTGNGKITGGSRLVQGPSAKPVLMTQVGVDKDLVRILAEVDGPVLNAIRQHSPDCALGEARSYGGHFAYRVFERKDGQLSSFGGGSIGGRIGERPKAFMHYDDSVSPGFVAGAPGLLVTAPAFALHSWNNGALVTTITLPAEDLPYQENEFVFAGETLHFSVGSLAIHRIKVWSAADGVRDLLTAGNDTTRGYDDLGTDGAHLVWNQGTRVDTSKAYPRLDVMVSPYATSTATLAPRLLRSDVTGYGFGTQDYVVGCGYAARPTFLEPSPGAFKAVVHLIRLSDGHAWALPDGDDGESFKWRRPLGITCDEIFGLVHVYEPNDVRGHFNIARMRIDALGPPTPP